MRAMILEEVGKPLVLKEVPIPTPSKNEVLIKVHSCGVCRTDLHIFDGELIPPKLPLILGHQIVGTLEDGALVGVPWLGGSCGKCEFCLSKRENLCDQAVFNGFHRNGGYAEYCTANKDFIFPLASKEVAPLLCAGLIGYRAFRLAQPANKIGFYGFGSSAHILIQVAVYLGKEIYVFTRPGDKKTQAFALSLGAKWAGGSDEMPPNLLDAALIFAPAGELYPQALKCIKKGGKVISAGIHMSNIPAFPYSLLWGERSMSSVANLTRQDGVDFLELAKKIPLKITTTTFALEEANEALNAIKHGKLEGSAVLVI